MRRVPKAAWKLFERMCATPTGWGQREFHTVYDGFGFSCRQGRDLVYTHPDHPTLAPAMVGRQNELLPAYTYTAVKRIKHIINAEGLTPENTR
jgi:hypothetical protein